jgi:probable rRNA maturation factor
LDNTGNIEFYFEEVDIPGFSEKEIREWIIRTIVIEEGSPGEVTFIFCNDSYLLNMNIQYLQHDTLTDIITFDYCAEMGNVSGDIFISLDRVRENATELNLSFEEELKRVIIHGVLHLLGYNDKEASDEALMRRKENYYLTLQA